LLSPYRNDKEFSDERMQKPISLDYVFGSFLNECKSNLIASPSKPAIRLNENEVFAKLNGTSAEFHRAICD
jgi:hypothetical protein